MLLPRPHQEPLAAPGSTSLCEAPGLSVHWPCARGTEAGRRLPAACAAPAAALPARRWALPPMASPYWGRAHCHNCSACHVDVPGHVGGNAGRKEAAWSPHTSRPFPNPLHHPPLQPLQTPQTSHVQAWALPPPLCLPDLPIAPLGPSETEGSWSHHSLEQLLAPTCCRHKPGPITPQTRHQPTPPPGQEDCFRKGNPTSPRFPQGCPVPGNGATSITRVRCPCHRLQHKHGQSRSREHALDPCVPVPVPASHTPAARGTYSRTSPR